MELNTIPVIATEIISSYESSPVLKLSSEKGTGSLKLALAEWINLKNLSTYSLKRIKTCSFPKLSWYVRIYSCTEVCNSTNIKILTKVQRNVLNYVFSPRKFRDKTLEITC